MIATYRCYRCQQHSIEGNLPLLSQKQHTPAGEASRCWPRSRSADAQVERRVSAVLAGGASNTAWAPRGPGGSRRRASVRTGKRATRSAC
jgi:hypothetical protein